MGVTNVVYEAEQCLAFLTWPSGARPHFGNPKEIASIGDLSAEGEQHLAIYSW